MNTVMIHHYDAHGAYIGSRTAQTRPNGEPILDVLGGTTVTPPEFSAGFVPVFDGARWRVEPDFRGMRYWMPQDAPETPGVVMDCPGPLPGDALTSPPVSSEQLLETRKQALLDALAAIDSASTRPLRAAMAGTATDDDRARLVELETQALVLRTELADFEAD